MISRKKAKLLGLSYYSTDRPCKYGHLALRVAQSGNCLRCRYVYNRTKKKIHGNSAKTINRGRLKAKMDPVQLLGQRYRGLKHRVVNKRQEKYYAHVKRIITKQQFIEWSMEETQFPELHRAWVEAGMPRGLSPSIDRIDSDLHYELGNLQWLTCSEHSRKTAICMWGRHDI